jgi:hypothetical protein
LDVGCEKYQYIDAQIKIKGGFLEFLWMRVECGVLCFKNCLEPKWQSSIGRCKRNGDHP